MSPPLPVSHLQFMLDGRVIESVDATAKSASEVCQRVLNATKAESVIGGHPHVASCSCQLFSFLFAGFVLVNANSDPMANVESGACLDSRLLTVSFYPAGFAVGVRPTGFPSLAKPAASSLPQKMSKGLLWKLF